MKKADKDCVQCGGRGYLMIDHGLSSVDCSCRKPLPHPLDSTYDVRVMLEDANKPLLTPWEDIAATAAKVCRKFDRPKRKRHIFKRKKRI